MNTFNNIKSKLLKRNIILSIDVTIHQDGFQFTGLVLQLMNGKIEIIKEITEISSENLKEYPIVLSINGKGIISKLADTKVSKTKITSLFPSINKVDFYSLYTPMYTGCLVTVIRQETIEKIKQELNIDPIQVLDIGFGPQAVANLLDLDLELPKNIGSYSLRYADNLIHKIEENSNHTEQKIFGEIITKNQQVSYITGVSFLLKNKISNNSDFDTSRKEFAHKYIFKYAVILSLSFLLCFFLGNALLNTYYNKQLNEISLKLNSVNSVLQTKNHLENEISKKEEFIHHLKLTENPRYAEFAMRIGESVPKEIQIVSFEINPITNSIRKNKIIDIKTGSINIEGHARNPIDYNLWRIQLKKMTWIKNIELADYQVDKKGVGCFKFKLTY